MTALTNITGARQADAFREAVAAAIAKRTLTGYALTALQNAVPADAGDHPAEGLKIIISAGDARRPGLTEQIEAALREVLPPGPLVIEGRAALHADSTPKPATKTARPRKPVIRAGEIAARLDDRLLLDSDNYYAKLLIMWQGAEPTKVERALIDNGLSQYRRLRQDGATISNGAQDTHNRLYRALTQLPKQRKASIKALHRLAGWVDYEEGKDGRLRQRPGAKHYQSIPVALWPQMKAALDGLPFWQKAWALEVALEILSINYQLLYAEADARGSNQPLKPEVRVAFDRLAACVMPANRAGRAKAAERLQQIIPALIDGGLFQYAGKDNIGGAIAMQDELIFKLTLPRTAKKLPHFATLNRDTMREALHCGGPGYWAATTEIGMAVLAAGGKATAEQIHEAMRLDYITSDAVAGELREPGEQAWQHNHYVENRAYRALSAALNRWNIEKQGEVIYRVYPRKTGGEQETLDGPELIENLEKRAALIANLKEHAAAAVRHAIIDAVTKLQIGGEAVREVWRRVAMWLAACGRYYRRRLSPPGLAEPPEPATG